MKLALVGDIGGTNARFALWKDQQLDAIQVHATADYSCPEDAIKAYLKEQGLALGAVGSVCLSVAGPVSGDEFRFTNNHWRLDRQAFCQALQVERLLLVNDFSAMALGMTRLQPDEFRVVCEGVAEPLRPAVVIGPGTGLGGGTPPNFGDGRSLAPPGGGGHVGPPLSRPPANPPWAHLPPQIGHVRAQPPL
ncbi:glucokinase, partial [Pseudomonas sp. KCJK8993]|uniref:glucokinase n=1 Tax=Pseudomonas sp. KCJK8993 TaxID=3344565 RepID=UPI0039064FDC